MPSGIIDERREKDVHSSEQSREFETEISTESTERSTDGTDVPSLSHSHNRSHNSERLPIKFESVLIVLYFLLRLSWLFLDRFVVEAVERQGSTYRRSHGSISNGKQFSGIVSVEIISRPSPSEDEVFFRQYDDVDRQLYRHEYVSSRVELRSKWSRNIEGGNEVEESKRNGGEEGETYPVRKDDEQRLEPDLEMLSTGDRKTNRNGGRDQNNKTSRNRLGGFTERLESYDNMSAIVDPMRETRAIVAPKKPITDKRLTERN